MLMGPRRGGREEEREGRSRGRKAGQALSNLLGSDMEDLGQDICSIQRHGPHAKTV